MFKLIQLISITSICVSLYPALQKSRTIDDEVYPERAFLLAATRGDLAAVEKLRDKVAINTVNRLGKTAVHLAGMNGHTAVLSYLLENRANPDSRDTGEMTALHWVAIAGFSGCLQKLFLAGANMDAKDSLGYTPLIFAAENGQALIVRELIRCRANLSAVTNEKKETALHRAAAQGHKNCAATLLKAHKLATLSKIPEKNFVDAQTNDLLTPLHYVAQAGHDALVDLLINYTADINAITKDQKTPLHLAVESSAENSVVTLEKLLRHSPDLTARDAHGATALDTALKGGNKAKIELIRLALGQPEEPETSSSTKEKKRSVWKLGSFSFNKNKKNKQ